MKIRRDIASIPARSAAETWAAIVALVKHLDSVDTAQLDAAASIIETLIAEEHPAAVPIIFSGGGPRVIIYCVYNEDAMACGLSVDPIPSNPTKGDWRMTAPCEDDDVAWMNKTLKARATRISVHSVKDTPDIGQDDKAADSIQIDWGVAGQ
jgi:hypothetical protein